MATKGTSYSDVNFSVPQGADPLGVGVPDLGRSSYDPIATIQAGWDRSRQDRLIRKEMDQRNYEQFQKSLPTVDSVNKNIASKMNQKIMEMGSLFKQQQGAGGLDKFARTEDGGKVTAKLSQLENEIATDIPIYNNYAEAYKKDLTVLRSPENRDKIDWRLTNENIKRMNEAEDVTEFAQPFVDNGGTLTVFKPEPQDIIGYAKQVGSMIEGTDIMSHDIKIDPLTNTMTTTQVTGADPKRVHEAYQTGYEMAKPNMKNAINALYEASPDKKNADGIVMDPGEWWANKFSGLHGTTTKKTTTRLPKTKDETEPSGLGGGVPRLDDGSMDIQSMMEPIIMNVGSSTDPLYQKRRFGKGEKLVAEGTSDREEKEFISYNMPLTGINEVFDTMTPADAIDSSTGEEPDRTKVASHKAASVSFMPTYNGQGNMPVEVEVEDENGNKRTKKYTVVPGKPIPKEVQLALIKQGVPMTYEPYLITLSVYGAALEEKGTGSMPWSDYISKHGKTIVTPWSSIDNAFLTKMGAEKYQIDDLKKNMAEMYGKINETP